MRPMRQMREGLLHPTTTLLARLALGLVFIVAALPKIADPPGFAKAIWAYQLVPGSALHPMALALPWLELVCGLALGVGIWVRAAATWVAVLLLSFGLALSINLARHHPVDCGCFGSGPQRTEPERLKDMRWALLRDLGLQLIVVQILAATPKNPAAGKHPARK